jgi:hypothetical protein
MGEGIRRAYWFYAKAKNCFLMYRAKKVQEVWKSRHDTQLSYLRTNNIGTAIADHRANDVRC